MARWPTAEEEKLQLFNQARSTALKTQALAGAGSSTSNPLTAPYAERSANSFASGSGFNGIEANIPRQATGASAGAALYSHAISSMSRSDSVQPNYAQNNISPPAVYPSQSTSKPNDSPPPRNRYPTAEEEKAALRYYQAKQAVDRHQMGGYRQNSTSSLPADEPIAYDALYPGQSSSSQPQPNGTSGVPGGMPSYNSSTAGNVSHQRSQSIGNSSLDHSPNVPSSPSRAGPGPTSSSMFDSAMMEKERLRRRFEAEDAAATAGPPPPSPPSYGNPPSVGRSQPLPPVDPSTSRHLTAAEEKAKLKAQFENEDNGLAGPSASSSPPPSSGYSYDSGLSRSNSYGQSSSSSSFTAPPPPPPLASRPPMEYIQEDQQEDAYGGMEDGYTADIMQPGSRQNPQMDFGLSVRPFSPLDFGVGLDSFDKGNKASPFIAPPPLPPKVPLSE